MKITKITFGILNLLLLLVFGCTTNQNKKEMNEEKISVIFDTDANNELDDQHALAYLLFSGDKFSVKGVTVNTTFSGGNIDEQYKEAERVVRLCDAWNKIPLVKGADGNFEMIKNNTDSSTFDGSEAVNLIIDQANLHKNGKLVVIAVGKLTNIALAVKKDPSLTQKIHLVWLGSNYPEPGEYNLENDIPAMNYLLNTDIPFEMVTVRYGIGGGTDEVRVTKDEAFANMPGLGPQIADSVIGRHGGAFTNFGDYSVNLFEHIDYYGEPPSRALFDMAAVAIVKDSSWAESRIIPAPIMQDGKWIERPQNKRVIAVWENFDKEKILTDFLPYTQTI
ncbi:MAG: nucleoside hydrolase [Bacteroidales bacterium]|nr:nucleoside hydrolase [Bacteroidales bacterium]